MSKQVLRGLGLNCLLAAILPATITGILLMVAWAAIVAHIKADQAGETLAALETWTRLEAHQTRPSVQAWLAMDLRWKGLAEVDWKDDVLAMTASAGSLAMRAADPPAWLASAVQIPQAVALSDGSISAAAPIFDREGAVIALAYGETRPDPGLPWWWLAAALGILALSAGLMAWYLTLRISRPVAAIQAYAESAASGATPSQDMGTSLETQALRSSVLRLVEQAKERSHP